MNNCEVSAKYLRSICEVKEGKKMNRAEIRRQAKIDSKKNKTYNMTKEQVDKLTIDMVRRAVDVSIGMMIAIPLNILGREYWEKTADKRLPKFMDECMSMYESIEAGVLTLSELIEDTQSLATIKSEYLERLKKDKKIREVMITNEKNN